MIEIFEKLLSSTIPLDHKNLQEFINIIKQEQEPRLIPTPCKNYFYKYLDKTDKSETIAKKLLKYKKIIRAKKLLKNMAITFEQKEIFKNAFENELIPFDTAAGELLREHHDHVVHSAYVFLLGCYFIEEIFPFCKIVNTKRDEFLKRWSIISMFHDSGYPTEIGAKIMHQSLNGILNILNANASKQSKDSEPVVEFKFKELYRLFMIPTKFMEVYQEKDDSIIDMLDLIARYMSEHIYNKTLSPIKIREIMLQLFNSNLLMGYVDHGLLSSAIYFNYAVNDIIKKHDSSNSIDLKRKHFFGEMITLLSEILTAIYLHNAYVRFPKELRIKRIKPTEKNLSIYLIMLIDELQIWGRDFINKQSKIKDIEIKNFNLENSSLDNFNISISYLVDNNNDDNDDELNQNTIKIVEKSKDKLNKMFGDQITISHIPDAEN